MSWLSAVAFMLLTITTSAPELERARALVDSGQLDEARAALEKTAVDPSLAGESLVLLTRIAALRGDHERGVDLGERAVKLQPESSEAHYWYAVTLRQHMSQVNKLKAMTLIGDYKEELAAAIRLDPGNLDAREEEIGFLLNAPGIAGGDVDKAKPKIEELKGLDWRRGTLMQVAMLQGAGNTEGAVKVFGELLARYPDDHPVRLGLAITLQEAKRFKEADQQLERLLAVEDANVKLSASYQLARSRVLGQYEQQRAVTLLADYIARLPASATGLPPAAAAYWRMGQAHEQLGQTGKARECFEKALALDPGNEQAKKSLKALPRG
jgi:tetratricopeptide (TPR) repeat protein